MYDSRIRPPATLQGKVKNCCRRIFTTTPVPISGLRTTQILTPWISICRKGIRGNSDDYVELLNTVVKPWIMRVVNGRPYVWQQDSAPCHTSGKSQNGCRRIFTTTPVPMFGLQTPQILYVALLRKTPITVPVLQKPN